MDRRLARAALCALLAASAFGCATYSDKTAKARASVAQGNYTAGLADFNDFLDVESADETPEDIGSDTALGLLERGSVLQALADYDRSARDFQIADKRLDLLDLGSDAKGEIGRYVYSDSATRYRSQPTEKLSLNAMNMLNYLAQGDLAGARVEARRYTTMQRYLDEIDPDQPHATFGSYLAGFVFEQLEQPQTALRYYDDVLRHESPVSLAAPVARLSRMSSYRGTSIAKFLRSHSRDDSSPSDWGDLLVVVNLGRVPYKVPERMPVGQAVGIAGVFITGDLSVLQYTAAKVVVYPELVAAKNTVTDASVTVGGRSLPLDTLSRLGNEIRREYESIKPQIIGAAVSRLIVRAAAAEGVRAAGRQQSDGLGAILALLTEATMVALDKPDTRSWTLLPDRVLVTRTRLPAGEHQVDLAFRGISPATQSIGTTVPRGGFAVVVVTLLR